MPNHDVKSLLLAFTYHLTRQIVGADEQVGAAEHDFLARTFPADAMTALGLLDTAGHCTPAFDAMRDEALRVLPQRLTPGEKLALVEVLVGAAAADGVLAAEEADALHGAARLLGVDDDAWASHLDGLIAGGRVVRDETGV